MKKLSYKMLYIAWAVLFALTAVLGFVFPAAETLGAKIALAGLAVVFFLPPWLILGKSRSEGRRFHAWLIGFQAAASIVLTVALLVLKNAIKRKEMEYDDLRKQASQEEHRRTELEEYLENRGTVDGIRQYAEEVLGLVYPGTVFYETTP